MDKREEKEVIMLTAILSICLLLFVVIPVCLVAFTGLGITFFAPVLIVAGVIVLIVKLVKKLFGLGKRKKKISEVKVED